MILTLNDSRAERLLALRALNGVGALVAAGFAVAATIDPALILPGDAATAGMQFYAQVYAARALPLTAVLLIMLAAPAVRGLVAMLVLSGLVQAADAAIGLVWHRAGMVVGGGLLAVIHLASAYWLWRRGRVTVRSIA
jgi:hypothetical protein